MSSIGSILREIRARARLTLREVRERSGKKLACSQQSRIEKGRADPFRRTSQTPASHVPRPSNRTHRPKADRCIGSDKVMFGTKSHITAGEGNLPCFSYNRQIGWIW